ncbi:hypothetical protein ACVH8U_003985 [Yersinia enterocolitica]
MSLKELVSEIVSIMETGSPEEAASAPRGWFNKDKGLYVKDIAKYNQLLETIYCSDKILTARFSRKTVFEFLEKQFPMIKLLEKPFDLDSKSFFKEFYSVEPKKCSGNGPDLRNQVR